jgi:uncharacterized protein YraI
MKGPEIISKFISIIIISITPITFYFANLPVLSAGAKAVESVFTGAAFSIHSGPSGAFGEAGVVP